MRWPWPKGSTACSETKGCGGGSDERRRSSPEIDFPRSGCAPRRSNISSVCSRLRNEGGIRDDRGRGGAGTETASPVQLRRRGGGRVVRVLFIVAHFGKCGA